MSSCDTTEQDTARTLLRLALGIVHDAGHVMVLCQLTEMQRVPEYAFLITLVNTRAYLQIFHTLRNGTTCRTDLPPSVQAMCLLFFISSNFY
jgi:hypothetical protein